MCGICGIYNYKTNHDVEISTIQRMNGMLIHRGPDDYGYHVNKDIGFGHRRLSIIDLNTGKQPITNEDESVVVIFNGEIYNYQELKLTLKRKGHIFKTKTDTEVIVHLYEEYGIDAFPKLIGMFAIALWDKNSKRLYLVRDHVGIKPLYFAEHSYGVVFASELQPIIQCCKLNLEIDMFSLNQYLRLGYIPAPRTIYKKVSKVTAGTIITFDKSGIQSVNYWKPNIKAHLNIDESTLIEMVNEKLKASVRNNMISDVPLGAFLSGGIDSSTITALMSEISNSQVKTFSIGFNNEEFNELPYAREIADMYKTEKYEHVVNPDAIEVLDDIIWHFGEPFSDGAALPTYFLSRMTSKYIKVVLSGDGGDELFAGYNKYISHQLSEIYLNIPKSIRKYAIEKAIDILSKPSRRDTFRYKLQWLIKVLKDADHESIERYMTKASILRDSIIKDLLTTEYFDSSSLFREITTDIRNQKYEDFIDSMLYADQRYSLPERMLTKVDRMSMAYGLEVRVPFLNHDFVDFVNSINNNHKVKVFKRKYILKKAMENKLPKNLLYRKKHGFEVPLRDWFKGNLSGYAKQILNKRDLSKHGFFKLDNISSLIAGHETGKIDNSRQIYSIIIFQKWYNSCYS